MPSIIRCPICKSRSVHIEWPLLFSSSLRTNRCTKCGGRLTAKRRWLLLSELQNESALHLPTKLLFTLGLYLIPHIMVTVLIGTLRAAITFGQPYKPAD